MWILSGGRGRQFQPAGPAGQVALVLVGDGSEVVDQLRVTGRRQHGRPVLVALATPDADLVAPEVDILDAKAATLEDAQARPVQQARHEPGRPERRSISARTSSRVRTTGSRSARLARTTWSSHGNSTPRTSR
jgi:hypothetical protein